MVRCVVLCCAVQIHEEDILLVKGPTGAPERKPFDTRRVSTEREWFLVRWTRHGALYGGSKSCKQQAFGFCNEVHSPASTSCQAAVLL